jgi:hypothetical protein
LLPAYPSRDQVCLHPSCSPRQHGLLRSEPKPTCSVEHRHSSGYAALPHGPSLRSGLCCPGPSTLNRPDPPHSQAHHNFIALRLICDAFAVRERLGDPRVVPSFHCTFPPDMPSPTTPGSSPIHKFQNGMLTWPSPWEQRLGAPNFPQSVSRETFNFEACTVHTFATACQVAWRPVRI